MGERWLVVKVPIGRNVRVNARFRRKILRVERQMLEQEGRKGSDERWIAWAREERQTITKTENASAGNSCSPLSKGGILCISASQESQEPGSPGVFM